MSKECCQSGESAACSCRKESGSGLSHIYGAALLRLWLAVRAIQTGVEKYAGIKGVDQRILIDGKPNNYGLSKTELEKLYDIHQYHGVPDSLMESFKTQPLMNGKLLALYDKVLGPALIVLGVAILLGIFPRTSLFALGLLYISLTWGLILLGQDAGIAYLGIHLILIVMALVMARHNRLCVFGKF